MAAFFATFRKPLASKNPSRDITITSTIASTSEASGHSSYSPSTLQRTSTSTSFDEQSLSTDKPFVDSRDSRPSTTASNFTQTPSKSHTLGRQFKPTKQSRHRHGLGNPRRALPQTAVSFSTPSIPRPPNYRQHSAFARRNELENAVPVHVGPCAEAFKTVVSVLDTILVRPLSVAIQQISKCFGGRVTSRRRPAWVARR